MRNYFTCSLIIVFAISINMHAQNLEWVKRMGSKGGDNSYAIVVDQEGNSYSAGSFSLTADFDPGPDSFLLTTHGLRDVYISKLDNEGNFVWADQIGGKFTESAYAMALDPSGYIYVTGSFRDTVDFDPSAASSFLNGRTKPEVYLLKLDFNGNFIWAQKVTRSLDTLSTDISYGLGVDPFGNVIVFGRFGLSADLDPGTSDEIHTASGAHDIFLSKFDGLGNFIWAKSFGGPDEQEPYAIAIDAAGNIYCTGNFNLSVDFDPGPLSYILTAQDTFYDAYILKLNSAGEFIWAKQISGPSSEFGISIAVDAAGNSFTAGSYSSTTDFNYGNTPVLLPVDGYLDGFILALDSDGNFRWVKSITGSGDQEVWAIAASPGTQGGLYIAGYYYGHTKVDDVTIPELMPITESYDPFISKLDFTGHFLFLAGLGGTGFDFSQAIAVNPAAPGIYSTGFFSGTCDFDPGINEYPLVSAGNTDLYVIKLDDLLTDIDNVEVNEKDLDFQVYPIPAHDELLVRIPLAEKVQLTITNILGVSIKSFDTAIENAIVRLDVSLIPNGVYFLQMNINNKMLSKKFIIEH